MSFDVVADVVDKIGMTCCEVDLLQQFTLRIIQSSPIFKNHGMVTASVPSLLVARIWVMEKTTIPNACLIFMIYFQTWWTGE